jgi:murein DD-endopeptidase MepM/ murein hydrolase activator NlpD
MAKYQFPIDGIPGKAWVVKSKMGWRIHPVKNEKKHHNGTDIVPGNIKGPVYIEAAFPGKVMYAGPSKTKKSNGEPDGFGYYVKIASLIDGEWYSHLYAHLEKGSLQVKTGDKVDAGKVLGKMGTSGMSTGVHLHWEIWKGKEHGWSADGKGFVEPIEFTKALIQAEKAKGFASESTPEDAPVADDGVKEPAPVKAAKPAPKTTAKPAAKPATKAAAKTHKVVSGDTLGKIAKKYGTTVNNLVSLNKLKDANKISVGQVIKVS